MLWAAHFNLVNLNDNNAYECLIEFGLRPTYVFSSSFQAAAEMIVVIIRRQPK